MLLAELEIRHSRAVAPTRRVAIGRHWLPTDPAPGFGGILLAGIVAAHLDGLDEELFGDLLRLLDQLELGHRIPQPQLRHRFQTDVVGLDRSRHKLIGVGEAMTFDLDDHAKPVPQLLGAVYAASRLHPLARPATFLAIRRALRWDGSVGPELAEYVAGAAPHRGMWRRFPTDERWARHVLGFGPDYDPTRGEVLSRFRSLIRGAHPDHGAEHAGAGLRILELSEARRILIGS